MQSRAGLFRAYLFLLACKSNFGVIIAFERMIEFIFSVLQFYTGHSTQKLWTVNYKTKINQI